MTIRDCIEDYRNKYKSNLRRIWLCPDIVRNPRVGKNYVIDCHIDNKLPESLLNVQVTKHWLETSHMVCIIYKASEEILQLVTSGFSEAVDVSEVLEEDE